ncbi:MAG: DNA-binding LacI/PurR family transcriptional regulator [Verrucomicrobiales bacterium]|jgi:DNA-binding LacI/PurR family transcriptional regulator
MVTQKEIAEACNVSVTTVSRVLSGKARNIGVTIQTIDRVKAEAERVGYVPNAHAQNLKGVSTKTLGVVVSDFEDPFIGWITGELQRLAAERRYSLVLEGLSPNTGALLKHHVDGLILVGTHDSSSWAKLYLEQNIPCVCIGHTPDPKTIQGVTVDEASGFAQLIAHLKVLGHERLGFIGGNNRLHKQRHEHFERLAGANTRPAWMVDSTQPPMRAGMSTVQRMIEQSGNEMPTAIVAASDIRALGAIRGLVQAGLSVPEQISLTGFDDMPLAAYTNPPLTTIRQPIEAICEQAFDRATGKAGSMDAVSLLPAELVIRNTSGPAPTR